LNFCLLKMHIPNFSALMITKESKQKKKEGNFVGWIRSHSEIRHGKTQKEHWFSTADRNAAGNSVLEVDK
jgi:hypothetical protein